MVMYEIYKEDLSIGKHIDKKYMALDMKMIMEDINFFKKIRKNNPDKYLKLMRRFKQIELHKYQEIGWQPHPNKDIFLFKINRKTITIYVSFSCIYIERDGKITEVSNLNKENNLSKIIYLYNKGYRELEIFMSILDLRKNINRYIS